MAQRALAVMLLAVLGVAPSFAPPAVPAAEPTAPIRTLVYDVAVSIGTIRRTARESAAGTGPGSAQRRRASASVRSTASLGGSRDAASGLVDAQGAIHAEIMAVTADNGLVVDLSETASGRNRAKVRLAITADGTVIYDPRSHGDVSGEELALARWLARGFYGEHPTEPGTAWTIDQSSNGFNAAEHYRVVGTDAHRITLTYAREEKKSTGVDAYGETREGSLLYDTFMVVPIHASYQGQAHRDIFGAFDTTLTSVSLTLRSDSFDTK